MADDRAAAERKLADDKKRLGEEREKRQKEGEELRQKMRGTPTPTQEENDLYKLGNYVDLAKDGSQEEPSGGFSERQLEGGRAGNYETRQMSAEAQPRTEHARAPTRQHSSSS